MPEHRKRSRVPVQFTAILDPRGDAVEVATRNISLKGMLCEPSPRVVTGANLPLKIILSKDVIIRIEAHVVRSDASGLAIDFTSMDENSFFHLRNIVRYRASDADAIDEELNTPAFGK